MQNWALLERNVVFRRGKFTAETILYGIDFGDRPAANMSIFNANNFWRPFYIAETLSNFIALIFQEFIALQKGF